MPIGVKVGGTGFLEKRPTILRTGPDFYPLPALKAVLGQESRPHRLMSCNGLAHSISGRTRRFLEERKLCGKVTLLAGGGLVTPMDFLKAMALGADAVFIGFAALVALVRPQASLFSRRLPIDRLFYGKGKGIHVSQAAHGLANFLKAAVAEMQAAALRMGKNHLRDVGLDDLSSVDRDLAAYLGIGWCGGWKEEPWYGQSRGYNFSRKED